MQDASPKNLKEALARTEHASEMERYWAVKDLLAQKFAAAVFKSRNEETIDAVMALWHKIIQADGDFGGGDK